MALQLTLHDTARRMRQFYALTKPRVTLLAVFCAVIGMFLATPGMVHWRVLFAGTAGIALLAGAAFAINCLIEQEIDAKMARTRARPLPRGELTSLQTVVFAGVIGGIGMFLLHRYVNALTMWLTFGTFVGYAVIYTILLKPATPQNIVIGGLSGAMPPLLGWTAVTGEVAPEALLLVLIIYAWTPPHFWALALYRTEDFTRAGLPMLPVTHGQKFTRLHVLLYTLILIASTLLPFAYGMSGWIYLVAALVLDGIFLYYAVRIYTAYSDRLAQQTFRYSVVYLAVLFTALLLDHYV
ncbi:MAG: protoheme IX farnesyltransferase [Betaproteobacteria bacterium RIFCSPLOWO2_12_FULL_64_23]|nr:MAG: protoheme IX farnesyltransferase [Betaproteobacteria bacterium RIFCSPLOWO2_12_FULL_64_23]